MIFFDAFYLKRNANEVLASKWYNPIKKDYEKEILIATVRGLIGLGFL